MPASYTANAVAGFFFHAAGGRQLCAGCFPGEGDIRQYTAICPVSGAGSGADPAPVQTSYSCPSCSLAGFMPLKWKKMPLPVMQCFY